MDCLFCKIVNKEIKSDIVSENDDFLLVKDINPKAPIHLLVIPKKHIKSINELNENDSKLISDLILFAKKNAQSLDFSEKGYKLLFNVGRGGGQMIDHIHLHILSNNKSSKMEEII